MAVLGSTTVTILVSRMEKSLLSLAQYQQYSPSYLPPQFLPPSNQIPQANQSPQVLVHNQNRQLSLPFPQKSNQLPAQPLLNPNNKIPQQPVYNMEGQNPQTYVITPLDVNNVQLRSGRVLPIKPHVVIQETRYDPQKHKKQLEEGETSLPQKQNKQT